MLPCRPPLLLCSVWRSSNGFQWSQVCASAPWLPRYLGNMAGDSAGNIFLAGGILALGAQPRRTGSDVWRSRDGVSWVMLRGPDLLSGPGKRAVAVLLAPAPNTLAWMSGVNPSVVPDPYLSDVWVSSNGGASFGLSTGGGAFPSTFPPRDDANGELTANGLFVVAAGFRPRPDEIFNDVYDAQQRRSQHARHSGSRACPVAAHPSLCLCVVLRAAAGCPAMAASRGACAWRTPSGLTAATS